MTKIFNFAFKINGVVGRLAHAKSSDPATTPTQKKFGTCTWYGSVATMATEAYILNFAS